MNGIFRVPVAVNEPVKGYGPGSPEKKELKAAIAELRSKQMDIPMYIGGKEVRTGNTVDINPPHELSLKIGQYHAGSAEHVHQAIDAALAAREQWANLSWEHRASIFLKAADLLAGPF